MKRTERWAVLTAVLLIFAAALPAQSWQIYDGSILPGETLGGADSLDLSSLSDGSPGPGIKHRAWRHRCLWWRRPFANPYPGH